MEHTAIPWIQIPAKNLTRAASFYEAVFDASFFFEELNNIPHAIFKNKGSEKELIHGAIVEFEDYENSGRGTILFFDATGDFETIMEIIVEKGGKILKEKNINNHRGK